MDYAAIAYATVVTAGGVFGFVKKGSVVSGLMGLAFGGLLGTKTMASKINIVSKDHNHVLSLSHDTILRNLNFEVSCFLSILFRHEVPLSDERSLKLSKIKCH
jgi:uncharacterized membrane protein (UPF0136 family)